MLNSKEIIDYFKLEQSHAKKELGQNFLLDESIRNIIVDSLNITDNEKVLEIGGGLGSLTEYIIQFTDNLTIVEYDAKFVKYLTLAYGEKVKIIKENILKFKDFSFKKIIGNLPYYLTTEIIEYIVKNFNEINKAVFMIQKECYKRITSLNGKDYSPLNILLNYLFDLKVITNVSKNAFFPMPNVDSLVFEMNRNKNNQNKGLLLYKLAKIVFINRRKTIFNNLNSFVKDKGKTGKIILEANLKENNRAEELTIEQYLNLLNVIQKNGFLV